MTQTQTTLDGKRPEYRALFVRLTPKDMRYKGSINLGAEIMIAEIEKHGWAVDDVYFGETIDPSKYDLIAFNIFYVTHQLNVLPFLQQHDIRAKAAERVNIPGPVIIAGGQGITNPKPVSQFLDAIIVGEGENTIHYVLDQIESNDTLHTSVGLWNPIEDPEGPVIPGHIDSLRSVPVMKEGRAVIELTRGCKYRCKFCMYSHIAGKYREKDYNLIIEQIREVRRHGVKHINFLSCNCGGYSRIRELFTYCIENGIRVANTDVRINEYIPLADLYDELKIRTLKTGVESFSEDVRMGIAKAIPDDMLVEYLNTAKEHANNLHMYVIYGLPGETDYHEWLAFLKTAKAQIKDVTDSKIRLEYNITNFEPSPFTPLEFSPEVNFEEKHVFLDQWLTELVENKYMPPADGRWYHNMKGRLGRKPGPYAVTMWLLKGGPEIADNLIQAKLPGVTRSMTDSLIRKIDKGKTACLPGYVKVMDE